MNRPCLLLSLLAAGCAAPTLEPASLPAGAGPAEPAAADVQAPQAPAALPGGEDREEFFRRRVQLEMGGAPYERATAGELAALAPRELTGAEADARARAAFAALDAGEQREVIEWFESECERLRTFQGSLIEHVLASELRAPESWPGIEPLVWYDPALHAPAQPIPRVPLAADSSEVAAVRNRMLGAGSARHLDSGWLYDPAARELRRLPHQGDRARVFENGLAGMPPGWDLAEVIVERALDDGSMQPTFAAFAHAYTDRWGGVYPGVTLYDAQVAANLYRAAIEMPDVDALGLVHELLGDWETWKSVVPPEQHDALYGRIGELFTPAFRYRSLRTNLARVYLRGNAELRDSYQHNLESFHALWESARSDPAALGAKLPAAEATWDFLQSWGDHVLGSVEEINRAAVRHATLDSDAHRVRATLLWVLDQFNAYDRIEQPPPFDQ